MTIYLSALIAVVGAVTYCISSNAKIQELGRLSFGVGLLAFLLRVAELPKIIGG